MKGKIIICLCLALLIAVLYCNWKFEVVAINPCYGNEQCELKVMTWNIHCFEGADKKRQKEIANLILKVDADFVQLNEFNQDSCKVMDSLLREKYPFTEEYQSRRWPGDIFYSKRVMSNSGHVYIPIVGKSIQTIKATIAVENDSVQLFGVHMRSNQNYSGITDKKKNRSNVITSYEQYRESQITRCFQADWTKVEVMKSNHPVIVMGDMNDFNQSKPLDILCSCGLVDSWWEGGNGYEATFHDGWMRLRIDHILHTDKLKLKSIKVIDTNLSDHNPVVAGFSINN